MADPVAGDVARLPDNPRAALENLRTLTIKAAPEAENVALRAATKERA